MEMVYLHDNKPWIIGYSGGKDSTAVCQLVFNMLLRLPEEKRTKPVHVVSSDTMVENPIVIDYLREMSAMIGESAKEQKLNLYSHMVYPRIEDTFWTLVIGLGYPTPEPPGFRWCTDRLKIHPSNKFIRDKVENEGEVIVLLGVRKAESAARARRIEGRKIVGKLLNKHEVIEGAYVYNPITELTTDDVWSLLLNNNNGISPWGSDNNFLLSLYKNEDGGECPFTITETKKEKDTPTCGNTRFGCWVCTMVKEDRSLKGFIESGERWLLPLREFRDWLLRERNNPELRDDKRRDGSVYEKGDGSRGFGPFTLEGRRVILEKLLDTEKKVGVELITLDELRKIDEIWDNEGDLSRRTLVETYKRIKGEELPWDKFKKPLYEDDVLDELRRYCDKHQVQFEFISKLIISVNQNKFVTRKPVLKEAFEKILNGNWLHHINIKEGFKNDN
ncbi:MAG: DNA phosphorothioation system sulfurtransferase DndC [Thermodesulfovibrionales bacterium]|nr:DNA phosphorothioation system sulfurtransferase DndC [Thermodesulfovibrionales bacterium]